MAREFSIIVSINAAGARRGGREFKQGADQVSRSSRKMTASMNRSRRSATALITTIGRMRGVATLAFAGFLGVGGIASVIRTISSFSTAMAQVNALMGPRGTQGVMDVLTERARELGATTLFTATQAAEGMRFLTLAGFDTLEVYQAIEPALNLATAGMIGLGESADIVSNVMSAFSIDAAETETVVDALAFTASRTNTDIRQLGQAMKFVGPIAGALGIDVQETAIALGILGNSGLQASLAGTSLRRVMSGLLNPSKKARKALAEMGLTSEELVKTMQGPEGLVNVVALLASRGIDAADAFLLFGQRGAPGLLSLVNQLPELRALTGELDNIAGAAKRMAKIMQDNLGGDARIAISSLQEAVLRLGDAGLEPFLRSVTQSFIGFIRAVSGAAQQVETMSTGMMKGVRIGNFFRENFETLKTLMVFMTAVIFRNMIFSLTAMGLATLRAIPSVVALGGVFVGMGASAVTARVALTALKVALLPFAPILVALSVAALFLFRDVFEPAIDTTDGLGDSLEDLFQAADGLVQVFDALGVKQRELAVIRLSDSIAQDKLEILGLEQSMRSLATTSSLLTTAQNRLEIAMIDVKNSSGFETVDARERIKKYGEEVDRLKGILENTNIAEIEAEIESLTTRIGEGEVSLTGMRQVLLGLVASMKLYRAGLENTSDSMQDFIDKFKKLTGLSAQEAESFAGLIADAQPAAEAIEEVESMLKLFNQALESKDKLIKKGLATDEDFVKIQKLLAFQLKEATAELNDQEKAALKTKKAFEKLMGSLDPVLKLEQEFENQLEIVRQEMARGELSSEEYAEAILKVIAALEKNKKELKEQCDEVTNLEKCMSDSAKAMQTLWDQALRNIQDAFADAFEGAFDSFESFADKLLGAFKTLIANILAEAAVLNIFGKGGGFFNDVVSGLTRGFGSGTSSVAGTVGSTASSVSGLAGLTSQITSAWVAFTAGASAFFQGASQFLGIGSAGSSTVTTFGLNGAVNGSTATAGEVFASGGTTAGIGAVAAGAGVGLLTGAITDAILGGRGDPTRNAIFSAIGGAIGSIWSPIGSVIGGAIGSFVDNLFGGAKKLESAVLELNVAATNFFGTQTEIVSKQRSFFRGKKFTTTTTDLNDTLNDIEAVFKALALALEDGAEALGASASGFLDDFTAHLELDIRNLSSEQITRAMQSFFERTMNAAITEWLNDVEGLSDDARTILMSFRNTVEGFVIALDALGSLRNLFDIDLVDTVTKAVEESQMGIFEAYQNALSGYREIIASYDGSIESIELLTNATAVMIQVQLDLVAIYLATGDAISRMFLSSADQIREALMSEEELFNFRKQQIDDLILQASMTTDPEELRRLAEAINTLGLANFNLLDEDQRAALGPEFIEFFDMLEELFGGQFEEGIDSVIADQAALDEEVSNRMLEAAEALLEAARIQLERDIRDSDGGGGRYYRDRDYREQDEYRA